MCHQLRGQRPQAQPLYLKHPHRDDGHRPSIPGEGHRLIQFIQGNPTGVTDDGHRPSIEDDGHNPSIADDGHRPSIADDGSWAGRLWLWSTTRRSAVAGVTKAQVMKGQRRADSIFKYVRQRPNELFQATWYDKATGKLKYLGAFDSGTQARDAMETPARATQVMKGRRRAESRFKYVRQRPNGFVQAAWYDKATGELKYLGAFDIVNQARNAINTHTGLAAGSQRSRPQGRPASR